MSISGTYYLRKWIPDPVLVHGPLDPAQLAKDGPGGPSGPGGPGGHKCDVEVKDYGRPPKHFFEGEMVLQLEGQDGKLTGTANGAPIEGGYYTGDNFFKVTYHTGPGLWEVWAHVDDQGYIEGVVSVGNGGGFPNLAYGRKL